MKCNLKIRLTNIGGAVIDQIAQPFEQLIMSTSNPGHMSQRFGGVGLNIAETISRLSQHVLMVTALGTDPLGRTLQSYFKKLGLVVSKLASSHKLVNSSYILYKKYCFISCHT